MCLRGSIKSPKSARILYSAAAAVQQQSASVKSHASHYDIQYNNCITI